MKRILFLYPVKALFFLSSMGMIVCATAVAQEYKYEIGGMAGMSMYMGDVNQTKFFQGWHPAAGAVFRKNFNLRWALKADLLMGKVDGDTQNTENVFPANAQISFSRNFYELGGQMEFNFLPYSDKYAYLNTSKTAPYVLTGLGLTFAPGDDRAFLGLNWALGVGIKYKIRNRINLGLEYAVRKLFRDDFDAPGKADELNLNNPYQFETSRTKNNDWYSTLMFSVTWDFGPNKKNCNNLE
ncbi:MAG: porin family protein [Dysgonamonadaceae bacterium]|jgi:opacity protein-like surface antigen|nr:porin family protein [Dysgonamonadaceae bacterium]